MLIVPSPVARPEVPTEPKSPETSGEESRPAACRTAETAPEQSKPGLGLKLELWPPPHVYGRCWDAIRLAASNMTPKSRALPRGASGPDELPLSEDERLELGELLDPLEPPEPEPESPEPASPEESTADLIASFWGDPPPGEEELPPSLPFS